MKGKVIIFICCLTQQFLFGQSEVEMAKVPLEAYMHGTSYNLTDEIQSAFIPEARLYLKRRGEPWNVSPEEYAAVFANRPKGEFNGRTSKIKSLKIYESIAYAEIEVRVPSLDRPFIDLLLLQKQEGGWKIACKTAIQVDSSALETSPKQKVVVDQLKKPWSLDFINENEVIVAEKDGDLLHVNLMSQEKTVIKGFPEDLFTPLQLDVSKYPKGTYPTSIDGRLVRLNGGIFEVLLDPNFQENQWIYVSYVSQKGDLYALKVIRAKLDNNVLSDIQTLLNPGPYVPGLYHFGGGMTFGKDRKLYITAGERLFYEYMKEGLAIAQDLTDQRGKIYRINPDGSIPQDNPDFGPGAVPGMYALGIRAAQGITLQPETGQIWFSEHGTIQGDEINLLKAGANYGWPNATSGKYRSKGYQPAEVPDAIFTDPIHYWLQTVAPTGLVFYQGYEFPEWEGNLIVPGLSRGSLWRLVVEDQLIKSAEELFLDKHVRLRKAEMSPGGKLYILTSEENGKIIEIVQE